MKKLLFLLFIPVLLFSCVHEQPKKRVYTEKDIEGYWALYSDLYPSELSAALTENSGKEIQHTLLRFYNDVCGSADTVYKVSGDTVFLLIYQHESRGYVFSPVYTIDFVSEERLMLREIAGGALITYYSVFSKPGSSDKYSVITCSPRGGGEGIKLTADSLTYFYIPACFDSYRCATISRSLPLRVDSAWVRRVNALYCRLTQTEILFACLRTSKPIAVEANVVLYAPGPPFWTVELNGSRGRESIGGVLDGVNPVLRALYLEVSAASAREGRKNSSVYLLPAIMDSI